MTVGEGHPAIRMAVLLRGQLHGRPAWGIRPTWGWHRRNPSDGWWVGRLRQ